MNNNPKSWNLENWINFVVEAYLEMDRSYENISFNTSVSIPRYKERIFCYELYHQMRKIQESHNYEFLDFVKIEGERVKDDLNIPKKLKKVPDFLAHKPDSDNNYLVMEVKKASSPKRGMENDLIKLISFMDASLMLKYKYGIFFIFGREETSSKEKITDSSKGKNIDLTRLEKRLQNRFLDIINKEDIKSFYEDRLIILWCYDGICKKFSNEGRWDELRIDKK
ncbi:MAG: hypothetical protein RXO36_05305 [Candidatus Nanopusillus acidilobi]